MQRYGDMKKRNVLATANPRRVTVGWDVLFGLRSQRVLHLIAYQFVTVASELHSQGRHYPHLEAAAAHGWVSDWSSARAWADWVRV
jgi:hypothetical protein